MTLFNFITLLDLKLSPTKQQLGEDEDYSMTFFVGILGIFLLALIFFLLSSIIKDFVKHVILKTPAFTKRYKFNEHNLRFAYKVAGCHMVVSDLGNRKDQYMFLVSYLKRRFPNVSPIDLKLLPKVHKHYPEVRPVFEWLNEHLDEAQKYQFLDYFIDLAFYNEQLSSREMRLVYMAGDYLGLSSNEIRSILSMRYKFYEDKKRREREHHKQRSRPRSSRRSKRKRALKILGIEDESASFDEIKKAYRRMAKKHHPDRFHGASEIEQEKANERFAVINEAYESLEEMKI